MATQEFERAMVLQRSGQPGPALDAYDRVLEASPNLVEAWVNRGWVLQALLRWDDALRSYERALELRPTARQALLLHGTLLHRQRRFDEALASYERAIALAPDDASLHFLAANTLGELRRPAEALAAYDQAIALRPDYVDAYRNRGILKLLTGDFAGGWPDYEHRIPRDPARRMLPGLHAPDWTGQALDGRSILVSDATGMGDAIHFVRYLPLLAARGAKVSFIGNPRLYRLFATLDASVRWLEALPPGETFDFHSKLLSLPYRFGTHFGNLPAPVPYLFAEREATARWRTRIGESGFKVGVCWRGNPSRTIDAGRSYPLAALAGIARPPGVRLISLQKRFGLEELETLPAGMQVETLGEDFDAGPDAFIDTAGAMQQLDLVITSDTSAGHLAGALGRPAWLALKRVPEWRWFQGRCDSPWYPTLRLFRQERLDAWEEVFQAMAAELQEQLTSSAT